MKLLWRTIFAVVIIILLKVLMYVMNSHASSSFLNQLLFNFQLLVIAWLLIIVLLHLFKRGDSWVARFLPVILALLVIGTDVLYNYLLEHPKKIPAFALRVFRNYYTNYERNVIQYEPCTVYDSTYFYQLIPGLRFSFGNIEFKNQYAINSESLRDDESALEGPQVICAGDSYTLGWGVEQDQTFAHLLKNKTGKTVLNTGNSSFGTVREMKRLSDLDTSVLEYLVIQYCRNDVEENSAYIKNNYSLHISPESDYKRARTEYHWSREYFPGKYSITITYDFLYRTLRRLIKGKKTPYYLSEDEITSARYFLDVLNQHPISKTQKILVTDINAYDEGGAGFLHAVDSIMQLPAYSALKGQITTIDVSSILKPEDYYILDAHMNARGHEKVAAKLAEYIR
jgi:hypothetical protein